METNVKKRFILKGVKTQGSADSIMEKVLKITGVEGANFQLGSGELNLELIRENALILKLLQYVVAKEEGDIQILEVAV